MVGGIIAGKINMYDLQTRMAKHFKKELTFLLNNQMGEDPGEQRWRSGKSTRLETNVARAQILASTPVSWVQFDVGSPSCPERSFSGILVFRSPKKPTLPNSNSIWNVLLSAL